MLDLLMTIVSGGATGIIGSVVGGIFKFMERREDRAQTALTHAHELELQKLQIAARDAETENELAIANAQTSREQLLASYAHDQSAGTGYNWVSAVLRLVRPVLTFALIGLTAAIYFQLNTDAVIEGLAMKAYIINTIVYTTSAAVLWWFGDRAMQMRK